MTFLMRVKLNELSLNFAFMSGQKFEDDYDFSKSNDLFGKQAWNKAVVACQYYIVINQHLDFKRNKNPSDLFS